MVIVGDTFSRIIEQFCESGGSIHHVNCTVIMYMSLYTVVLLADAEPMSWAINTSFIKVVTILVVMLPLSLLRNIAMLEKVSLYLLT